MEHMGCCGGVIDGGDGHECAGVVQIAHYTHLKLVFGLSLEDVHAELQVAHGAVKVRHGVYATHVEKEAVVAAVGFC